MNTMKLTAALTAALLAGAMSTTAFAAETLPTEDASVTFRKGIDMTNAVGAGGIKGKIEFEVTPALESDLPTGTDEKAYIGTADQLMDDPIEAEFMADAAGITNKESDVTVNFDTTKFTEPGIYYYRLTEKDPAIHGLTASGGYLMKVRVVNADASDPDGTAYKIDYAVMAALSGGSKTDLITNTYTTYGLTVTKKLEGDFADYSDDFDFTLSFTDPDSEHMASVTVRTKNAAGTWSDATVLPFGTDGTASINETIKGGDLIEVTGLPAGATYTITESGNDAAKYTTAWTTADGESLSSDKTLPEQTMTATDTALTVTNTRNATTPTGLLLDAAPYGAMLALAAGSGLVFFRKRRRED